MAESLRPISPDIPLMNIFRKGFSLEADNPSSPKIMPIGVFPSPMFAIFSSSTLPALTVGGQRGCWRGGDEDPF
eukprot:1186480-Prorocentrum_minimum.AAC.2